jgi:two-component system chemotaxis response regulator CheB
VFDGMPRSALASTPVDHVAPLTDLPPLLARLARAAAGWPEPRVERMTELTDESHDARVVAQDKAALEDNGRSGQPSMLTCPDCGGVLWELRDGDLLRYRCHVGHAYSPDSLEVEQTEALEGALWTALRALEEGAALARRMASHARQSNHLRTAEVFDQRAAMQAQRADLVRQTLANGPAGSGGVAADSTPETGE